MDTTLDLAWLAFRKRLEERRLELHEAVRTYPAPIARCDDQLPGLIAQRDAAQRALRLAQQLEALVGTIAGDLP